MRNKKTTAPSVSTNDPANILRVIQSLQRQLSRLSVVVSETSRLVEQNSQEFIAVSPCSLSVENATDLINEECELPDGIPFYLQLSKSLEKLIIALADEGNTTARAWSSVDQDHAHSILASSDILETECPLLIQALSDMHSELGAIAAYRHELEAYIDRTDEIYENIDEKLHPECLIAQWLDDRNVHYGMLKDAIERMASGIGTCADRVGNIFNTMQFMDILETPSTNKISTSKLQAGFNDRITRLAINSTILFTNLTPHFNNLENAINAPLVTVSTFVTSSPAGRAQTMSMGNAITLLKSEDMLPAGLPYFEASYRDLKGNMRFYSDKIREVAESIDGTNSKLANTISAHSDAFSYAENNLNLSVENVHNEMQIIADLHHTIETTLAKDFNALGTNSNAVAANTPFANHLSMRDRHYSTLLRYCRATIVHVNALKNEGAALQDAFSQIIYPK